MSTPAAPIPHLRAVPDPERVAGLPAPAYLPAVPRPRLLGTLTAAPTTALAVLLAPAGYGKTTLLRQWEAADDRPFAWVALHADHNDPDHLLAAIAACMDEVSPPLDGVTTLPGLTLGQISLPRAPVVIVLDDAQVLTAPAALAALGAVVGALRPGSVVALASRERPRLPLGRLRAQGVLAELGAEDLAMTDAEATTLLADAGLALQPDLRAQIMADTEGWPAALRLAAVAVRGQEDPGRAVATFGGDDRIVSDFLRDEVLAALDDDALDLLTCAASLSELEGGLCDAVLGREGSGGVLRDLAHGSFPLRALDRRDERFCMHPLLAGMLRADLHRRSPARERKLHRNASAWYERRHDDARAIEHALAAGDENRAAQLLWNGLSAGTLRPRTEPLGGWLAALGDARIAGDPSLALVAALAALARGDHGAAERWATSAASLLGDDADAAQRACLLTVRASIARDGAARMGEDAAQAAALREHEGPWYPTARLLTGVAHHLTGDPHAAAEALEDGARLAPDESAVRALCLAQQALIALERRDGEQGFALGMLAIAAAEAEPGAAAMGAAALAHATTAFAAAHTGRVDRARSSVRSARDDLAAAGDVAPWIAGEIHIALARAELRLSNAAEARAHLADASRALRRAPDAALLHGWIDDAWCRADSFAAGAVAGPSALTTAELRVLRFLPSHLSFREIADRLHVSSNTVKTQAHAIYRKLDASSRSEAVTRARDVGLVDG